MIIFLTSLLCYTLEMLLLTFLILNFTGQTIGKTISPRFFSLLLVVFIAQIDVLHPDFSLKYFLFTFVEIIIFYIIFNKGFLEILVLYSLSYMTGAIIQLLLMFSTVLDPISTNQKATQIIGSILTLAITIIFYFFVPLNRIYELVKRKKQIEIILGNIFVLALGFTFYAKTATSEFASFFVLLTGIIFPIFLINWDYFKNQKKILHQEKELSAYNEYFPIIEELIDYVRMRQHDFDNHLQAIQMLPATHKDYETLADALENYSSHITEHFQTSSLLKLNTKLISAFLFSKIQQAEQEKKQIVVQIRNYNLHSIVPEYDWIDIMGILIDNAIEAVNENDSIQIILDSHENKNTLIVRNHGPLLTPELRENFFKKDYTTKTTNQKNHGLGLYSLKRIVDFYDGQITLYNENDYEGYLVCFEIIA